MSTKAASRCCVADPRWIPSRTATGPDAASRPKRSASPRPSSTAWSATDAASGASAVAATSAVAAKLACSLLRRSASKAWGSRAVAIGGSTRANSLSSASISVV